jgi:hypothetical protein
MHKVKGIKDFLDRKKIRPKDVTKALLDARVPGNWRSYQNIYNLINGKHVPRDPYAYIVLSELTHADVNIILYRYSDIDLSQQVSITDNGYTGIQKEKEVGLDWDDLY